MPRSAPQSGDEFGGYWAVDYQEGGQERVTAVFLHNPGPHRMVLTVNRPESRQSDGSYSQTVQITAEPGQDQTLNVPAGQMRARVTSWVDTDGETYPNILVVYNSAKGPPSAFPQAWEKPSYTLGHIVL